MLPYPVLAPWWVRRMFPSCLWEMPAGDGDIYLTFDDGPDPVVTPFVLDALRDAGAKATFFCIGKNVEAHPGVYERILAEGHAVGNHTYSHLDGWKTRKQSYLSDVEKASSLIDSGLFRPPYGRIRPSQIRELHDRTPRMKIVMWTLLSGDFDPGITKERCLDNVFNNMTQGSIITFHDSRKAEEKLRHALPKVLKELNGKGWNGRTIGTENYEPSRSIS